MQEIGLQIYTVRDFTKTAEDLANTMKKIREIGFVFFTPQDVVRHSLLEKIITAYNDQEAEKL